MKTPLIILGSGGFAREAYSWLPEKYSVEAFYSSIGVPKNDMFGIPIIRDLDGLSGRQFLLAVGTPTTKALLWDMAMDAGMELCDPIIHPTAIVGRECKIGMGSIVCPQAVITACVEIGLGFLLNISATIGHECKIGDFVTVSPGANVSGNVDIGSRSYIGTNSCIREKLTIGDDCVIGMGAVVVKNVLRGKTFIGNPARQL